VSDYELPKHLSYSQVTTLLKCGEKYRLTRLMHLPEPTGWAMIGGTAVHETTEEFDKAGVVQPDPADVRNCFEEKFEAETANQINRWEGRFTTDDFHAAGRASKAWPNKEDDKWWREHGPTFCHSWFNFVNVSPYTFYRLNDEPAIEIEAEVELAGSPVKFIIDRVCLDTSSDSPVIVDLKSGANMPKDDMQLALYAEGLYQTYGFRPRWGQFFDCRKGVSTPAYDLDKWPKERLDFVFGKALIMREQGIFLANPSNLCSSCGVRQYCLTMKGELAHTVEQPWEGN
jgi:hypothetical protein